MTWVLGFGNRPATLLQIVAPELAAQPGFGLPGRWKRERSARPSAYFVLLLASCGL